MKLFIIIILAAGCFTYAQQNSWNNRKCAVVLTYDDGLNVHLDNVIPVLDSLGFKGTFYIAAAYVSFKSRLRDWQGAAKEGHELGNHTLFHPCEGKSPGREWVKPEYDLSSYSVKRMTDEIIMANVFLSTLDEHKDRTFAYPCGDINAGGSSYVTKIKSEFVAARSVEQKMQRIDEIDLFDIGSFVIDMQTGGQLIEMVKQVIEKEALLVFLFHGVGGEHSINVSLEAHNKLLEFLKANEKDIWVAPLVEVADFIRNK